MNKLIAITALNILILVANMVSPAFALVVADAFDLVARPDVSAFPVPVVSPSDPGKVIAFDVMPSYGALENPDNGFAWHDTCDADLMHDSSTPVACARIGIKHDRVELGSRNFNGSTAKDVYIIRDRQVVGKFDASGLTVYGTVKAKNFANLP